MKSDPSSIELSPRGIESCEQRLALSASLMGAWLAPLADPLSDHPLNDPLGPQSPAFDHDILLTCPADSSWIGDTNNPLASNSRGATPQFPLSIAPAVLRPDETNFSTFGDLDETFAQAALNSQAGGNGSSLIEQSARIGATSGFDGTGQTIVIIDSGIAYDHHAFGAGYGPGTRVVGGWDFAENDADPYDDAPAGYHGSHVAGLASGITTTINGDTFRGVAPGADLVALRVFDDAGNGNLGWIEQALRWVHENQDTFESPITTINLSLGTELTDANRAGAMAMLEDELQLLYEDDILVFAAAGNSQANMNPAADALMYPASSRWVSAVGSVDTNGNLSGFSQRAEGIFAAEGQQLLSSVPEHVRGYDGYVNDYASLSGTSMASPQVAAASMLVRQAMHDAGLDATPANILARLESTSISRVDSATGLTYRTLNLEAAVDFGSPAGGGQNDVPIPSPPSTIAGYTGTGDADEIMLDLRSVIAGDGLSSQAAGELWLSDANGRYQVVSDHASTLTNPIVIEASTGSDTIEIFGSAGSEQLTLRPTTGIGSGHSQLVFPGGVIELRGFENISFIGGGGEDRATLYDSSGDDQFRSNGAIAKLDGRGFAFQLEDVNKVFVYATAGGNDTAHITDTAGDDQLVIRPQFSSLRGEDQFRAAFGFERVFAYAENGGYDTADLGDSAGDDVMSISETRSLISSAGYRASASGFESVVATASRGGVDTARIYVDDPNGTWHTSSSLTQWTGEDGTVRIARGFERSEAIERFETVPVGAHAITETTIAPQMASVEYAPMTSSTLEEHLRGLRQLFEEYADAELG
jgi:hypothetical protein